MGAKGGLFPPPGVGPDELDSLWEPAETEPTEVPGWDCDNFGHMFEVGKAECIHCGRVGRHDFSDRLTDDELVIEDPEEFPSDDGAI